MGGTTYGTSKAADAIYICKYATVCAVYIYMSYLARIAIVINLFIEYI